MSGEKFNYIFKSWKGENTNPLLRLTLDFGTETFLVSMSNISGFNVSCSMSKTKCFLGWKNITEILQTRNHTGPGFKIKSGSDPELFQNSKSNFQALQYFLNSNSYLVIY